MIPLYRMGDKRKKSSRRFGKTQPRGKDAKLYQVEQVLNALGP